MGTETIGANGGTLTRRNCHTCVWSSGTLCGLPDDPDGLQDAWAGQHPGTLPVRTTPCPMWSPDDNAEADALDLLGVRFDGARACLPDGWRWVTRMRGRARHEDGAEVIVSGGCVTVRNQRSRYSYAAPAGVVAACLADAMLGGALEVARG